MPAGSCMAAGYISHCCVSGSCLGNPPNCHCDAKCYLFDDCCTDVPLDCNELGIHIDLPALRPYAAWYSCSNRRVLWDFDYKSKANSSSGYQPCIPTWSTPVQLRTSFQRGLPLQVNYYSTSEASIIIWLTWYYYYVHNFMTEIIICSGQLHMATVSSFGVQIWMMELMPFP